MISIYTRTNNPLKKEFWKWVIKKILRKYSGPDAVLDSLKRGLKELNIPFEINPLKPHYSIVHVLSGVEILKKIIKKKKKNQIKTLVVGPTLVQTPYDQSNIIQDENIDTILFPSQWVKDWFTSLEPKLTEKIKIWPSGVEIPQQSSTGGKILVFKKKIQEDVFKKIINILEAKGLDYELIRYKKYKKEDYHKKLLSASLLIYLQETESQGLALQEAWSYNVPTLVLQSKNWQYGIYSWSNEKVSAPYLTEHSGKFFTLDTFNDSLDYMLNHIQNFEPKKYCLENLSDKVSVQKYLELIKR